jgi:hypothetical protein
MDFARKLQGELKKSSSVDTVYDLANEVIEHHFPRGFSQTRPLEVTTFKQELKYKDAPRIAAQYYMTLSKDEKYEFHNGVWTHTIRTELQYAVSHVSPLVMDLNGDGVKLLPYTKGVFFDIDNDNFAENIGWVSPEDGQLARDLNGNGKIDNITELFGDDLISAYYKLSLLDSNDDGIIDNRDEFYNKLLVWQDKNSNGYSEKEELKTLAEAGIKSISLATKPDNRVIEGNTISETSSFTYHNGRKGEVADVHYHNDDMNSWYSGINHKPIINKEKYEKQLAQLHGKVLATLEGKITQPDEHVTTEEKNDWLAIMLKASVQELVKAEKAQSAAVLDNLGRDINKKFITKVTKRKAEKAQEDKLLPYKIEQEANKLLKEAQGQLLNATNTKNNQEKDDINSRYTQLLNKAIDEAHKQYEKDVDAFIAKKQAEINPTTVTPPANPGQIPIPGLKQAFFDRIKREAEEGQKRLREEYIAKKGKLVEQFREQAAKERDVVQQKNAKIYQEKEGQLIDTLTNKARETLDEQRHNNEQTTNIEQHKLLKLFRDQYHKQEQIDANEIEALERVLKGAADKIYKFVAQKILESQSGEGFSSFTKFKEAYDQYMQAEAQSNIEDTGIKIDPATILLPLMRGHGQIPALHIAMSHNKHLKDMVNNGPCTSKFLLTLIKAASHACCIAVDAC